MVETRFGRNYELFEAYVIKNVFVIPDSFVLPHLRDLVVADNNDEDAIDEEIAGLAARLQVVQDEFKLFN